MRSEEIIITKGTSEKKIFSAKLVKRQSLSEQKSKRL